MTLANTALSLVNIADGSRRQPTSPMASSATNLTDSEEAQPLAGADFDLWYVGVLLMVLSTFFGALGNVCIKQSFNVEASAAADSSLTPAARRRARLVSWAFWILGAPVFTIVLGAVMNVAAFAFAAQSLLSPFAATTIVWNSLLAPCCLRERLTRRDLAGTFVVVAGCAVAGASAPHSAATYTLDELLRLYAAPAFIAYAVAVAVALGGACVGRRATAPPALRRLCASALPGLIVGNTNVLAKSLSELLAQCFAHTPPDFSAYLHAASWYPSPGPGPGSGPSPGPNPRRNPHPSPSPSPSPKPKPKPKPKSRLISLGALLLPLSNLYFLGRALEAFSASKVVPVYFSTIVLVSTCSGGIYFGELGGLGAGAATGLALGVLLVLCGVYLITSGGGEKGGAEAEAEAEAEEDARVALELLLRAPEKEGTHL